MRIFRITEMGKKLARNTNAPDNDNWRALRYLDKVEGATDADFQSEGIPMSAVYRLVREHAAVQVGDAS